MICEGATEKKYLEYLVKTEWPELSEKRIYFLDAMGKFNIHRYMNLFEALRIPHSVLADEDSKDSLANRLNPFIRNNKNEFTIAIRFINEDFESFLGIKPPPRNRRDRKPLNVLLQHDKGAVAQEKIVKLKEIAYQLVGLKGTEDGATRPSRT